MTYTIKEEFTIKTEYEKGTLVSEIAEMVGKPTKSVIAKLSAMKVYVPKVTISKVTGDKPKTKKAFAQDIADILELPALPGLEKADKGTLMLISATLKEWLGE